MVGVVVRLYTTRMWGLRSRVCGSSFVISPYSKIELSNHLCGNNVLLPKYISPEREGCADSTLLYRIESYGTIYLYRTKRRNHLRISRNREEESKKTIAKTNFLAHIKGQALGKQTCIF